MPDTNADDRSNLTTVRGQSIDVLALQAELMRLRGENAHLRAALAGTRDGATVATLSDGGQTPQEPSEQSALSPRERVELFRRLFRGRTDTFPVRWHSATSGKSGYAPACSNEWVPGVCEKPRVKCTDCENRKFIALSDQVIFEHLALPVLLRNYPTEIPNSVTASWTDAVHWGACGCSTWITWMDHFEQDGPQKAKKALWNKALMLRLVETRRIELLTFALRTRRSPS